jgi:hypothetical protein
MLSILRKARLKDKEMRILMLSVSPVCRVFFADSGQWSGQCREDYDRQEDYE